MRTGGKILQGGRGSIYEKNTVTGFCSLKNAPNNKIVAHFFLPQNVFQGKNGTNCTKNRLKYELLRLQCPANNKTTGH